MAANYESEIEDLKRKFESAIRKRESLQATADKLRGKLELAQQQLRNAEEECRAKNIDPAQLDELLEKLIQRFNTQVAELESALDICQRDISKMESNL
jgi:chromosome segregation ATPase